MKHFADDELALLEAKAEQKENVAPELLDKQIAFRNHVLKKNPEVGGKKPVCKAGYCTPR